MKQRSQKQYVWILLSLFITLLTSGCVATKNVVVKPTTDHYVFLQEIKPISGHYKNLYKEPYENQPMLAARLTEPHGYTIKFHNNLEYIIGQPASEETGEPRTFLFREGVYPFSLYFDKNEDDWFSGLMVVYNIDETIELATFGETDETRLFREDMFKSAEKGVLGQYTISFDDKEVISYWMGNRDSLYPGGQPTVEVDFSYTPELKNVVIDGYKVSSKKKVLHLDKYYVCRLCDEKRQHRQDFSTACNNNEKKKHSIYQTVTHKNYPIEMETEEGQRFQGYIRNLVSNKFTAFMSIPCEIPSELFDHAARGTISKLTVQSPDDKKRDVAEIVFGLAK